MSTEAALLDFVRSPEVGKLQALAAEALERVEAKTEQAIAEIAARESAVERDEASLAKRLAALEVSERELQAALKRISEREANVERRAADLGQRYREESRI